MRSCECRRIVSVRLVKFVAGRRAAVVHMERKTAFVFNNPHLALNCQYSCNRLILFYLSFISKLNRLNHEGETFGETKECEKKV